MIEVQEEPSPNIHEKSKTTVYEFLPLSSSIFPGLQTNFQLKIIPTQRFQTFHPNFFHLKIWR